MALRFDNRVAIITGGGGGLGRTYAVELAKRGCKVVVNDLGGDAHGTSASTSMADKVVNEIKAAGGIAVANYDSVEFGEKIVKTAIDNFGRIDIVINNAGILRDVSLTKMTDKDWNLIFTVHMYGAFSVSKAAWPYMKKQNYGRIVNTSSNAAIFGNFGQTNYSAAKSALIGFTRSLALEGEACGIKANVLIPTAASRLTQTIWAEEMMNMMKPEYVTPLVVNLVHESIEMSGHIFEAGAGWYGTMQYYRGNGAAIPNATAEDVNAQWDKITSMEAAHATPALSDAMAEVIAALGEYKSPIDPSEALNKSASDFPSHVKSSALFKEMNDGIQEDPSVVKSVNAIIFYSITDGNKELAKFTLDFKSPTPSVYVGDVKDGQKATVSVTVADDVFVDIGSGKLSAQKAFMGGKLKVKGNVMLLQKLQAILEKKKKAKL